LKVLRKLLMAAPLVILPLLASVGAISGWFSFALGPVYTDLSGAERAGRAAGAAVGWEQGQKDGFDQGYEAGITKGQEVGLAQGMRKGKARGYKLGFEEGYEEGYEEGFDEGYELGLPQGRNDFYDEIGGAIGPLVDQIEGAVGD
jgi:hypothetical protein